MVLNIDMAKALWSRFFFYGKNKPHSSLGWSSIGYCLGSQYLNKKLDLEFDGFGNTMPGSVGHEYIQNQILPIGSTFTLRQFIKNVDVPGDTYLVCGHEVPVFCVINGKIRTSNIDTVVLNLTKQEIEIFDWKFKQYAKYSEKKVSRANMMQFMLYMHLYRVKRGHIVYIDMKDYEEMYPHLIEYDQALAEQVLERMQLVDENNELDEPLWLGMIEGIMEPDRKDAQCKWCRFAKDVELLDGSIIPSPCLALCSKHTGKTISSIDEAVELYQSHQLLPKVN